MSGMSVEFDQAEHDLNRMGYDETMFSFDHVPDRRVGFRMDPPPPVIGVIIINRENRRQKVYLLRRGKSWRTEFIADLQAGLFGVPAKGMTEG